MSEILKRSSFGLLRTNPRLTTNIKLVADSNDKIYLESINADPLLSKSIYKGFPVKKKGSYSYDVKTFYSQNGTSLPKDIAYTVFEVDASLDIKKRYKDQYDFTYGMGAYPKNSKLYSEEFAIFSPIWLERDNLPDYFVIFKMDGPVTINPNEALPGYPSGYTGDFDNSAFLNDLIQNPSYFFDNYIKKAKIIKTFDLTESTSLGTYIRSHINSDNFPESSLYASLEKGEMTYWNGISYKSGGFCSIANDIYSEYTLVDKTITEADDFITDGFHRNGVICANILNLEFLFDDNEQTNYSFSRYFGMYVNSIELGKFTIDDERLYEDRDKEFTQYPRPLKSGVIGSATNLSDQIQYNSLGIKVYPHVGPSGPYEGRLMTFSELQNPRFGYVKDVKGNFYSIDNVTDWSSQFIFSATGPTSTSYSIIDTDYLRIKNDTINWNTFTGFEAPFDYIPAISTDIFGRPATAFKVVGSINDGDEIRIRFTDWTNSEEAINIDTHTIIASSSVPAGTNSGLIFSTKGTYKEIASAIVSAISAITEYSSEYQIFSSISIDNQVIVFSRVPSENWNKLKMSIFSTSAIFPFEISNQYLDPQYTITYQPSPISISTIEVGYVVNVNFDGGNNRPISRAIIEQSKILEFRDSLDTIYVKTKTGFSTTGSYGLYLDEPIKSSKGEIIGFNNIDKYFVINLEDMNQSFEFGSSKKIALYKLAKNSNGYLSILPIKDFDFDFESTEYNKDADSSPIDLYNWYMGMTGPNGDLPLFNWYSIGSTSQNIISDIIGPSSSFVTGGGFQQLIGYSDDLLDQIDPIVNEYDRLKENTNANLALSSRVVPFINKWVYDNECVDVRENGYRLNVNGAFGFSNFSPSFDNIEKNSKFFTHEWYYLQQYPPYMSFEDKLNSFSYFDNDLYFPEIPSIGSIGSTAIYSGLTGGTGASANLLSVNEDYFLSYFTRETIDGLEIPRDFKYSIFSLGSNVRGSETLFRGAKVEIRDRSEFSHIDYNKNNLKYVLGEKYNGYKFSAILTYGNSGSQITCIKNDVFKAVTLVIQANLNDALLGYTGPSGQGKFIDRSMLYCIKDQLEVTMSDTLAYTDKVISGNIESWTDDGTSFTVSGVIDANGNLPSFNIDLTLNENGSYNDVYITSSGYTYVFSEIHDASSNTFKCNKIIGLPSPSPSPLYPNGSHDSTSIISYWLIPLASKMSPFTVNPVQIEGGYNGLSSIIESISFGSIADLINSGSPEIRYINVSSSGIIEFDTYSIDLLQSDYPMSSDYLMREVLQKTPSDLQISAPILGYKITANKRITINPICRYRGTYNPKWRNVLQFVDTNELKNESLSYFNIQILTDLGWISDAYIGQIKDLYYNKVNVENPNIILKNNSTDPDRLIYPLIGEIAIDFDNFFVFKSNWDVNYYRKNLKRDVRISTIGTREPKENKSFFGSKTIAIPNDIRLETFPTGYITESELVQASSINNTSSNIVSRVRNLKTSIQLTLDVYVTNSIQDWLIADGFGTQFYKYINDNYSFGNPNLDDDIKDYISENIFDRYAVKEIIFWEKIWNPVKNEIKPPLIETNLTDLEKIQSGYVQSKNFKTIQDTGGGLNFSLIYTIPKDKRTSISFSVILEKK